MADKTETLDRLAYQANFADVDDKHHKISIMGKRLNDYLKGERRMFYCWRNWDKKRTWSDIEIVTFDNPLDFSSARMYFIPEAILAKTIITDSQLNLSNQKPTCSGKDVVKVLQQYAKDFANKE